MTTIIDVAKAAGVSFKTVARVLNGETGVRDSTRKTVLNAASKLNYKPNNAARNLRSKSIQKVILLGNNPSRSFVESMRLGALLGCQRLGYELNVEFLSDIETIESLLADETVVGAIIAPPMANSQHAIDRLNQTNVPFIRVFANRDNLQSDSIGINDRAAAHDMTRYLISLGHSHIGFIKGPNDHDSSHQRLLGYQDAMRDAGHKIDDSLVVDGNFTYVSGLAAAEILLAAPNRPSAIFASNDDMAAATLSVAYKFGISVPDALSVAGFDDSPIAVVVHPGLTTIQQAVPSIAERAIGILSEQIKFKNNEPVDIEMSYKLVKRGTTAPYKP